MSRLLDLGPSDVHVPSAMKKTAKKKAKAPSKAIARAGLAKAMPPNVDPAAKRRSSRGMRVTVDHPRHGKLEIRHMHDGVARLCRTFVALDALASAPESGPVWVQIALPGRFEGHRAGSFELNEQVFREIITNYSAVDGGEVAFDFEHASEMPATEGTIPSEGAPAQGWIRDLKIEPGCRLFALVDWLEPARSYIRTKKYRYVSPAIRFGARHPTTGKAIGARLTSVALTNQPFLRGLQPLVAKDGAGPETISMSDYAYSSHEYMPKLRGALRLPELATAHECSEAMERLCEAYETGGGAPVHGVDVMGYVGALRDAMCSPLSATIDELFDAAKSMIAAAIDETETTHHAGDVEMGDAPEENEEIDMSDKSAVLLGEAQAKVSELTVTMKALETAKVALETEKATLSLQLKDAESRASKAEADAAAAKAKADEELKTLRDAVAARDAADATAKAEREAERINLRVDDAFETYKDKKSLTDDDKEAMAIVLKANPEKFEKLYPVVRSSEQHLLRDLTKSGEEKAPPPGTGDVKTISMCDMAKKIAKDRSISLADAQLVVARMAAPPSAAPNA